MSSATLKRGYEDYGSSPAKMQPAAVAPAKRFRLGCPPNASPTQPAGLHHNMPLRMRYPHNPDSAFNVTIPQEPLEAHLDRGMVRMARQRGQDHLKAQGKPSDNADLMFSLDQVKLLVQRATEEREARLRVQFDGILQEKLDEQYRSFTKFNASNVQRQMRESMYDYMS
eukprot:comp19946_c1_seq1/m.24272 comp19946_c1_seq1/g.24272  ORF comp19946_c1_seq1/g.24272 comp19946_c1_seq1/m.24272 type:complete len:169 (-) comp19946_c1_seq1:480-986(-)